MPATLSRETVRAAQILLVGFGFPLDMDGIAGPATKKAVQEFQRRRHLPVTGDLDAATLKELGLPPQDSIEFTVAETDVPPFVQRRIEDYARMVDRQHRIVLDKARDALISFQTTMATASLSEATPDLVPVLASAPYEAGVSLLESFIKDEALGAGVAFVLEFARGTREELKRAAAAAVDRSVATYVKEALRSMDARRTAFRPDRVVEEAALKFLESPDRQVFLDRLFAATEKLEKDLLPPLAFFELKHYEAWINIHFNGLKEDGRGVIAYRFAFEDREIEVLSCRVAAPHGDRIEDAVNELLAGRTIPGVVRPIDLRVRKRACFRVENPNVPGLQIERSGWLGTKNEILQRPSVKKAEEGFNEPVWRQAASTFMR
jgi:hypothetical protein